MEQLSTTDLTLAPEAPIDLQMHTTYSDGDWTPEELTDYLAQEQFALVAITDHDRVDTVPALQQLAFKKGLPILVAAEMSTSWRGEATDMLCYGFNPEHAALRALAQDVLHRQQEVVQETYVNLLHKGYTFGEQHDMPRQPLELFMLLERHNYLLDEEKAQQDIDDAGFYYTTNDIALVVDVIHRSGGVCLIAHPGRGDGNITRYDVSLLDQLRQEVPIDGFEAYYPVHTPEQTAMYLEYAQKHNLLVSSGSDSHRPAKKPIKYRAELSRRLLERLGIKVQ